jgi:3-oxoacyl-[acyl-carrier protein] reductase
MSKFVLITGASRGIGRATAIKFATEGYGVIAIGKHNPQLLDSLAEEIQKLNMPCITYLCDVSNAHEVNNVMEDLAARGCIPDILINNAAISYVGLLQDMSVEEWNSLMGINLNGVYNLSSQIIPHWINKKSGRIINISSMWGNVGASCEVAYSASKGGVNAFTKALSKELAPSNIPVNAIAFGMVDTQMNGFLSPEDKLSFTDDIPAGRILTVNEAADIIYSIANLNTYVTGQIITADGGYT